MLVTPRILTIIALAAAVIGLALLSSACRPPADRTAASPADARSEITVELLTRPARVGPAAIQVVVGRDGVPVADAAVQVTGDMTHAGMVPVVAHANHQGEGVYLSEGFAFDMAGDWIITADVTYPDGEREQGTLAVSVAR